MLKKIASVLLLTLLVVSTLSGCGGAQQNRGTPADKEPIPLPDFMLPSAVEAKYDDDNRSSAYYEAEMSVEEVKEFYKSAFNQLAVEETEELNEAELLEKKIVPEGEADSLGNIVWAYYGKYTLPEEEQPKDKDGNIISTQGYVFVICSQQDKIIGVEVAVAYRAINIAEAFGFNPLDKELVLAK